ncbi:hypothetical protein E4U17_002500 [Claviceps sp. LM77 group G4]|nr:hypothetical protein E4U17_002500 [Claviceps sp. LM77 group G4]KAG6071317.1 hypothetical protein E4U33_003763 [Claviceps sp. LM78 group G4]KAG6076380.1 hypothetical protein E4U16_002802 [Claviceps sp. LM84 group G4]
MSQRGARMTEFEERDYYAAPRRSEPRFENAEYRTRRVTTRSPPPPVRERDSAPSFLREDARRTDAGPMVLRKRDIETWDRRPRSPSPVRVREERLVHRPRSESPHFHDHGHEHSRTRIVERETERERERARSPSVVRRRSPSAHSVRFVERRRRSPSPIKEHIHTRIIERQKAREPSPSPSPSPPPLPPVVRGPILEREVITHYTDIDHGVIRAKVPSPPPPPRPRAHTHTRERETDIDISLSKNRTEVDVDIHRSTSRHRSPSRERRSHYHDDDEIILRRDLERIHIDDRRSHRRSHSAAPTRPPLPDDEADYISSRIDSRGRIGEAYHGATKDWAIVDVPPGTEKVRMDGVGGASTETEWSKYSGVRRTKFIPEREGALVPARQPSPAFGRDRHSSVTVYDREREIDVDVDIERRITRTPAPPPLPSPPTRDMWTEMTKDLVCREAIEEMGYRYEETTWFFYVMDYLTYDQVLQLTELSSRIRRRRRRYVEADREREYMEDWYRRHPRDHYEQRPRRYDYEWDDERVREREVIYDSRGSGRGYMR